MKLNKEIPQVLNPDFFELDFHVGSDGMIHSLRINLQSEPVEFVKQTNE